MAAALTASIGGAASGGCQDVVMIGPRLFRSRWSALLWAGGILWTAYDVAAAAPDPGSSAATANAGDMVDATGLAGDCQDFRVWAGG